MDAVVAALSASSTAQAAPLEFIPKLPPNMTTFLPLVVFVDTPSSQVTWQAAAANSSASTGSSTGITATAAAPLLLRSNTLISGPVYPKPGSAVDGTAGGNPTPQHVDMANSNGLLTIPSDTQLYIQRLTLTNLPRGLLNTSTAPTDPSSHVTPHALPLWAFHANRSPAQAQIFMDSVTLILSDVDYQSLVALATDWPDAGSLHDTSAALAAGTSALLVDNTATVAASSTLVFKQYIGWGLNATNLKIVSDTPYTPPAAAVGGSSGSKSIPIGAIVGGVVGGGVVLPLLAFLIVVLVDRCKTRGRDKQVQQQQRGEHDLESGNVPHGSGSNAASYDEPTFILSLAGQQPKAKLSTQQSAPSNATHDNSINNSSSNNSTDAAAATGSSPMAAVGAAGTTQPAAAQSGAEQAAASTATAAAELAPAAMSQAWMSLCTKGPEWGGAPVVCQLPPQELLRLTGLRVGDPFLTHTAPYFSWVACAPQGSIALEDDSTVTTSHNSMQQQQQQQPNIMQLSNADVAQHIQLVAGSGLLGKGATSVVFKCLWPSRFGPNTLLAAKLLSDPFDTTGHALRSFAYEVEVLKTRRHPNIVRMHGYCLEPPHVCIIMELLPASLKQALYPAVTANSTTAATQQQQQQQQQQQSSRWPATARDVIQASLDVARGLAHLHQQQQQTPGAAAGAGADAGSEQGSTSQVVHRDLKPANLLVSSQGRVKISDFGLAREHEATTVPTDNPGAGTLQYLAPELLTNDLHPTSSPIKLTAKADIYSLGVIMWELVAKQVPWKGAAAPDGGSYVNMMVTSGLRPSTAAGDLAADNTSTMSGNNTIAISDNTSPHQCSSTEQHAPAATHITGLDAPATFSSMPAYVQLMHACWHQDRQQRPTAVQVCRELEQMLSAAAGKQQ